MNFQALNKQRKLILIAAVVGVISIFLPWVTVGGIFGGLTTNGFNGGGVVVFLAFVAAGVLAFMGDQTKPLDRSMWLVALVACAIALLFAIIKFAQISNSSFGIAKPGYGLWIAVAIAIALIAATWMFRNPGDTLQGGFDSLKKNISSSPPVTPPPSTPTNTAPNKLDQLERLIELKNQGKITDEEYTQLKSRLV